MAFGFGSEDGRGGESRTLAAALRSAGRVALWALVALLLVRGTAAILSPPSGARPPARRGGEAPGDSAASAFAIRFARAYVEDPSDEALAPFLAAGAHVSTGRPPSGRATGVAQAEVVQISEIGDGRSAFTVACELRDSRTLYLAVPIVRFGAGEVAALGAPSIVAVPAVAGVDPERPRPLTGPDAGAIRALVARFLPAYLGASKASELSYLLAPGARVIPLGGGVELAGVSGVSRIGSEEGRRREVIASAQVEDPVGGAAYPLAYRLALVRRGGRWYVAAVRGAVA